MTAQNASLQGLANRLVELKQMQNPESQYHEPSKTTIDGEPAFKIQQIGEQGEAKFTEVLCVKENKLYIVGYNYYSDQTPQTIQKMINSLRFT
jgi:hypothetical protein